MDIGICIVLNHLTTMGPSGNGIHNVETDGSCWLYKICWGELEEDPWLCAQCRGTHSVALFGRVKESNIFIENGERMAKESIERHLGKEEDEDRDAGMFQYLADSSKNIEGDLYPELKYLHNLLMEACEFFCHRPGFRKKRAPKVRALDG